MYRCTTRWTSPRASSPTKCTQSTDHILHFHSGMPQPTLHSVWVMNDIGLCCRSRSCYSGNALGHYVSHVAAPKSRVPMFNLISVQLLFPVDAATRSAVTAPWCDRLHLQYQGSGASPETQGKVFMRNAHAVDLLIALCWHAGFVAATERWKTCSSKSPQRPACCSCLDTLC